MRSPRYSLAARANAAMRRVVRALRVAPGDHTAVSIDDEMRYHIECEAAERVRRGMSPDEAWRTANLLFGGIERHKEEARDARGVRMLEDTMRDASYGARVLRRNPAFTAAVILTFALGIGCTSAIFSLANGILLRPLPYAHPTQLVTLWERDDARKNERNVVAVATLEAWRERLRSFAGIAALVPRPITLDGTPAIRIKGVEVSPEYFRMLGVHPALGRDFDSADVSHGGANVLILSDAFWRARYGADSSIVGRQVSIDARPMTVIGVMGARFDPPRFGWIEEQPLWLPFVPTADKRSWGRFLHVVARLAPGASIASARSEMLAISAHLSEALPDHTGWSASVVPLAETITGDVWWPIVVAFTAVALLLIISMVNVANLVTSFLRRRAHELALRRAVGATVARLARQQLVLSVLLGAAGTALGLALAVIGTRSIVALAPSTIPRLSEVTVNGTVFLFATSLAVLTTIAVGVGGAYLAATGARAERVAAGSGRATIRLRGSRLVATEVAIGLVLTVLAALMVRSLTNLRAVRLGFDPESMVTGRVSLPPSYANDTVRQAFFDALLARTRAIPGVSGASLVTTRPFACCAPTTPVSDAARPGSEASSPVTDIRYADERYFATARIPLIAGTAFDRSERADGDVHVVISRSLAHALWGDANPLGKTVSMGLYGTTLARVIGVVGDVRLADPHTPVRPSAYLSTERFPSSERDIVVRGTGSTSALLDAVRVALASIDPSVPLYMATSFETSLSDTLAQDRFTTALLAAFAIVALVLAAVGVYGVLAGDVICRRKEIGIRIALGSPLAGVTTLVLRRALRPAVVGAALGILAALAIARSMSALVFGVATWDPASFVVVTATLLAIATVATLVPALRAARVAPTEALRTD